VRVTNLDQKQHHYLGGGQVLAWWGAFPLTPRWLRACVECRWVRQKSLFWACGFNACC